MAVLSMFGSSSPTDADPIVQGAEHCVVNVTPDDPLNLRARPGTRHPVLTRLPYGRCGLIATGPCRGNWCPIEDGHYAGWVHRQYISAVSRPTHCLSPSTWPQSVALRAWPSEGSRVLVLLAAKKCGVVLLPYEVNGWQKIRHGGWEGWVRLSDLRSDDL
jgi:SH3-like domain-containing protein